MTQIIYVDKSLEKIHLYTIGDKLKGLYAYSDLCIPDGQPTFTAHFHPKNDKAKRVTSGFSFGFALDDIHDGTRKKGLILSDDDVSFSEAEIKTSELTTKPVLKSSKNIKDRFNMDWWLKEQLNKKVTISHLKAGIDECNPFAIRDGKDYRFFMTMCSAQDQEMDIDPKTNELLYKRCSMSNITELTPEGAAYAAIVKGSGDILSVIPEEVSDRLFNRIGLSHVSVSFVDFKNSQKIISQLTDYVLEGCLGVSEKTLRGYPALSKTPFKNGIQRMDAYLAKQSA